MTATYQPEDTMHANELRCSNQAIDDRLSEAEALAAAGEYTTALYKTISAIEELSTLVTRLAKEAPHG